MNLSEYKTQTLARADVDDIVMIEAAEKRPTADRKGFEAVVHTTEGGQTIQKLDVHLMRVVDGVKKFEKEFIALINQGEATEEVVFREKGSTEPDETPQSAIESYVFDHANNAAYQDKKITKLDTAAPSVYFTGIKDLGDGTGKEVTCFAYMKAGKPETIELSNQ